ncbi:Hypothetical protein AA314_01086 [Archangium gephyra]|uniref:Uncharacterized protein n=1 Tax=Archangium gephyra TaxID=48 RepID=A0AAC8TB08_9BACT|nr:Hypothetical protein AA314_01086 [Archangium gephyra]
MGNHLSAQQVCNGHAPSGGRSGRVHRARAVVAVQQLCHRDRDRVRRDASPLGSGGVAAGPLRSNCRMVSAAPGEAVMTALGSPFTAAAAKVAPFRRRSETDMRPPLHVSTTASLLWFIPMRLTSTQRTRFTPSKLTRVRCSSWTSNRVPRLSKAIHAPENPSIPLTHRTAGVALDGIAWVSEAPSRPRAMARIVSPATFSRSGYTMRELPLTGPGSGGASIVTLTSHAVRNVAARARVFQSTAGTSSDGWASEVTRARSCSQASPANPTAARVTLTVNSERMVRQPTAHVLQSRATASGSSSPHAAPAQAAPELAAGSLRGRLHERAAVHPWGVCLDVLPPAHRGVRGRARGRCRVRRGFVSGLDAVLCVGVLRVHGGPATHLALRDSRLSGDAGRGRVLAHGTPRADVRAPGARHPPVRTGTPAAAPGPRGPLGGGYRSPHPGPSQLAALPRALTVSRPHLTHRVPPGAQVWEIHDGGHASPSDSRTICAGPIR